MERGVRAGGQMARVVLAMSGGVDSSVAAHLLCAAGHDVIGVFMRHGEPPDDGCSTSGAAAAGAAGRQPHRSQTGVLHRQRRARCPPRGRPARHPVLCDRFPGRFRPDHRLLHRRVHGRPHAQPLRDVQQLDQVRPAVRLCRQRGRRVRGHGALRPAGGRRGPDGAPGLFRGVDRAKDQSYVLFGIERRYLSRMLLAGGRLPQERDPPPGHRAGARRGRQARQPGNLFRPLRRPRRVHPPQAARRRSAREKSS